MKKFLKIAGITLLVLILLLAVTPFLFQGKILELVKKEANNRLNAKVDFGKLNLSFLRNFPNASIIIDDIYVVGIEEFEGDTLASIDRLNVGLNIKSLFGDQIEINRVKIKNPKVLAKILEDGKANWDIMKETEDKEEPEETPEEDDSSFKLQLKNANIENGKIVYDDREGKMYASLEDINLSLSGDLAADITTLKILLDVDKLNFLMGNIPYLKDAKVKANMDIAADLANDKYTFSDNELSLNAIKLNFEGWLAMLENGYDMDIKVNTPNIEFKHLLSMIPAIYAKDFASIQTRGNLQLDAAAKGIYADETYPAFDVKLNVSDAYFKYPDLPKSVDNININLAVANPGGSLDKTNINLSKFHFEMAQNPFDIYAKITTPISDLQFDAGAKGTLNLNMIKEVYPLDEGMDISGTIKADLDAAGRMSQIEKEEYESIKAEGDLVLSGFVYKSDDMLPVEINNASLNFTPRYVHLNDLNVKMGNNDLQANGKLENFIAYVLKDETIKGELNISSSFINVNDFLSAEEEVQPDAETKETSTETTADTAATEEAAIEIPKNINFNMNADLKKITYDDIILENIKGKIKIADGKLTIDNAEMNAFGGSMDAKGYYDTGNAETPDVKMALDIKDVLYTEIYKQTDLVKQFAPIFENMTGKFSVDFNFNTKLDKAMSPVYETMSGNGVLTSKDFSISNLKVLDALAGVLKNDDLKKISAKDIKIEFAIDKGRIATNPFDIKMGTTNMNVSGSTGLDQTIDYVAKVKFPQQVMKVDMVADVKIGGTFSKPTVKLGASETLSGLKDAATEQIKQVVTENLQKLIDEATKQKESLVAAAQKQGDNIRSEAQKAGQKIVDEAEKSGQKLIDEANKTSNALAKAAAVKAAEAGAKKLKEEAQRNADNLNKTADEQATKLVKTAEEQGDKLIQTAQSRVE